MENEQNRNLNTTPPPAQPVVEPKSPFWRNKSFVLGIVVVLLVPLLLVGIYKLGQNSQKPAQVAVTPTPTPAPIILTPDPATANWQTYTNTAYGFQIKYPPGFKVVQDNSNYLQVYKIGDDIPPSTYIEGGFDWPRFTIIPSEIADVDKEYDFGNFYKNIKDSSNFNNSNSISLPFGVKRFYFTCGLYFPRSNDLKNQYDTKKCDQILSTFKFTDSSNQTATVGTGCKIGGCSSEICQNETDEDIASICIYKESYACYKTARCEKQVGGSCGWSQTQELKTCLGNI